MFSLSKTSCYLVMRVIIGGNRFVDKFTVDNNTSYSQPIERWLDDMRGYACM